MTGGAPSTSDIYAALAHLGKTIAELQPGRVELGAAVWETLKRMAYPEGDPTARGMWPVGTPPPPAPPRIAKLYGVPAAVREDMPADTWRILDTDGQEIAAGRL